MASGVSVADECIDAYKEVKLGHKHRYVIFSLNPGQDTIVVEHKLAKVEENSMATPEEKYSDFLQVLATKKSKAASYDEFVQELLEAASEKQCRYGVFDAEYTLGSGQQRSKLVFVVWNPDTSPIKQKMIYSSSKDALKKAINFVAKDFQANDQEDLAWSNLLESVMRHEASGVAVSEKCISSHDEIKQGKKHRYVIFAVNKDLTEIEPIKYGTPECTYDDFVQELKNAEAEGQSRYGIFDCHFTLPNGQERQRLCMVFWNPDTAPVKQKMVYSSSKDAFKKKIKFTGKDYQANDYDDLRFDNFLDFMKKHEVSQ